MGFTRVEISYLVRWKDNNKTASFETVELDEAKIIDMVKDSVRNNFVDSQQIDEDSFTVDKIELD